MKRSDKIRLALLALLTALAPAACTTVDDTLGGNLIPDNQQMRVGTMTLDGLNPKRYVETRLFRTDSIVGSNLSYGYFGTQLNDTLGMRRAGFLTQMINYYRVDEGYFGFMPVFDSAQLMLSLSGFGPDTTSVQAFAVYEVLSNDYLTAKEPRDSTFYLDFDPEAAGVYDPQKPLFRFELGGKGKYPAQASAVTLTPTDEGRDYVRRLMLQKEGEKYYNDYSIYSPDSLAYWVEEFRGLYIAPDPDRPLAKSGSNAGTIYATELGVSGLAVYGRNRVEEDPSLVQDTIGMVYYFYDSAADHGNISVNAIARDFSGILSEAQVREPQAGQPDERPADPRVFVEGLGGPVTEMTFTPEFFAALEEEIARVNAEDGKRFTTLAFSQARMSIYFSDSRYDWTLLDPYAGALIPEMNAAPSRLGLYTDYKKLTPISDYAYAYEKTYQTSLAYGGYINRSRGCYVMNITGYLQQLWNSYLKAKEQAGGQVAQIDWEQVRPRTVYIGPEAYSLFTPSFGVLQGAATESATPGAPIRFDLTYNLIQ